MRVNSHNLENALLVLETVLDGDMNYWEICQSKIQIGRLVVAHSIMQSRPKNFFVPDTQRLIHPYSHALGFLVGDSSAYGYDLVQTSQKVRWHRPAEPMEGQPVRRAWLTTPPQVLDLLQQHPNTVAITTQLFQLARDRLEAQREAAALPTLQRSAARIVEEIHDEGSYDLGRAVYNALKAQYG